MKNLNRIGMFCAFIFMCLLSILLCSNSVSAKKKIELTMYMTVGDVKEIPISVNNGNFFYTSDDLNVVKFTDDGRMIAVKSGTATVMLSYIEDLKWVRTYYLVKVHERVKNLKWKGKAYSVQVGKTYQLKVKYKTLSRKNILLKWESSNSKVATVSKKGTVKGIKQGAATIYCSIEGQDNAVLKRKIKVLPERITDMQLTQKSILLKKGELFDVKKILKMFPENAKNKSVKLITGDKKVCKVMGTVLKAQSVGYTDITIVSRDNSDVSVDLRVSVEPEYYVDKNCCIAHRGLCRSAPENTILAFKMAGESGFYGCEADVWMTKDGKFVVQHDESLLRCCGVDKKVGDLTLEELRNIPITNGFHYEDYKYNYEATIIPTLSEYLWVCKKYGIVPQIEIKFNVESGAIDETNAWYRLYNETRQIMESKEVMFASCYYTALSYLYDVIENKNDDNSKLFLILGKVESLNNVKQYKDIKEKNIGMDINLESNPSVIRQLISDGVDVDIWCVDDPAKAEEYLRDYRVNYITTNFILWE